MLVPQEISLLVSSDPSQGARNLSADGSQFDVFFDEPLQIPRDALNITVTAPESTVWWTIPNISAKNNNNKLYIFGDDNQAVPVPKLYIVDIDDGLYDLSGLNNTVLSKLEALGARTDPTPLINFGSNTATQRVVIRFNYSNTTVDFTPPDTPRDILGFDSQVLGPYVSAPLDIPADNVAAFNQINSFLIKSDLVNRGIRFNNAYSQIITQVLIDVLPGSQIVSSPRHPAVTNAQELAGTNRNQLRFYLTDQRSQPVDTNGEYWTSRITIKYYLPMVVG